LDVGCPRKEKLDISLEMIRLRTGSEQKGGEKEMARNINTKNRRVETATVSWSEVDAGELKEVVRDGLVAMNITEREEFIGTLEAEMRRTGLNMRAYLIPLGIPGRSPEDLTPTEVAHMMRFLKLNVPQAMLAIERSLARYEVFSTVIAGKGHRIAA
jgi:hypothetical protein